MVAQKEILLSTFLLMIVLLSAVSVSYSIHLTRKYVGEISVLTRQCDELQIEWEKLLLEINMLSSYSRIETIATRNLGMQAPAVNQVSTIELGSTGSQ